MAVQGASSLGVPRHGEVERQVGDGIEDPHPDAAIHLIPLRIIGAWRNRAISVRFYAKLTAHSLEGVPFGVIGVLHLQCHRNMNLDKHRLIWMNADEGEAFGEVEL